MTYNAKLYLLAHLKADFTWDQAGSISGAQSRQCASADSGLQKPLTPESRTRPLFEALPAMYQDLTGCAFQMYHGAAEHELLTHFCHVDVTTASRMPFEHADCRQNERIELLSLQEQ